jgi:hypothetical protein
MSSSEELSKTLEDSLRKLETKTGNIERLAIEVKENEKRLSDIANSTISYISQLKSQFNAKIISGTSLANNIIGKMDEILISLKKDPKKISIDETLEQLQGILQTNKSSTQESGAKESGAKESGTQESGTQESGAKESGTQDSGAKESGTQDSGFFSDPLGNISKMISGDSNVLKPASPPESKTSTLTDSSKFQKGGYRYSTPKKNKKTKKHILKKSKARGRGRNSNKKSFSNNRRIKSYFRKTRKKNHSK